MRAPTSLLPVVMPRSLLLAALLSCAALPACQGKDGDGKSGGAAGFMLGQPAPPLAAKTIDGDDLSLADLHGQVVLVNVWATWCKPCERELPELAKLHREHSPQGFSVLGVSVDKRQLLHKVRAMVTSYQLGYPTLFDPEIRAIDPWKVVGYPTSVLVGRDGTIRWRRDGMIHPDDPDLTREIESALAQPAS
jgi:cytochrome c biogenesis protein CcmG, thiol:disulfide interchange protein DsbE